MFFVGVSGNDPKNDFEIFLKNYAWLLAVGVAVIIILVIVIIFVIKNRKSGRVKKKEESLATPDEWIDALGGKDNVVEAIATGSRLSIKIKNTELINRESLTNLGVTNIVMMSDKITLVTNLDNQKIVEKIENCLQN